MGLYRGYIGGVGVYWENGKEKRKLLFRDLRGFGFRI